jgi:tRNA(adenine34) deaminase
VIAVDLHALMGIALAEARAAPEHGDVPVGAVVAELDTGAVVARRHNERELLADPTAHAEILALRDAASSRGSWRLDGCVLVVTLEPCPMCAGAAVAARVSEVAFGAPDPKAGALGTLYNLGADSRLNHEFVVHAGVRSDEAAALLKDFFADRRG